jgi:signal transduction histidine kinase
MQTNTNQLNGGRSARAAELGAPTSTSASLAASIPEFLDRLFAVHDPETCHLHVEFMGIREQLGQLGRDELARVDTLCPDVPRELARIMDSLQRPCAMAEAPRALRSLLTRLRCVLEVVRGGTSSLAELTMHYARSDLSELLRRVVRSFDELAASREIRCALHAPASLWIEIDAAKIELALLNLVFNAFKHTPEGESIAFELAKADRDDVVVRVTDGGPGIDTEVAGAIFDRGRLSERSVVVTIDGLGLSLAHSRDLVRLHGGSLAVVRGPGPGATFEARLPARAPAGVALANEPTTIGSMTQRAAQVAARELEAEARVGKAPVERNGRPLVLVVEPSRAIQRLLAEALDPSYATAAALDGATGLRLAADHLPDLVILDTSIPDLGVEAWIRELRARPELDRVPILALTSGHDPRAHVQLLERGVQDLVRKPFLLQELFVRTRNLVATKQTRDLLGAAAREHQTDLVALASEVYRKQRELERAFLEVQLARELAESGNRVKSNFLRMVSHELKTPVTAMQLQMLVLDRHRAKLVAPAIKRPLESISRSLRKLLTTVDTTIEWARIEAGRCELVVEELDLSAIVKEAVADIDDHAKHKGLEVTSRTTARSPRVLVSDGRIVRIVLANLLARAVSVSEDGIVAVELEHRPEGHCVRVRDCGPVLAPQERQLIFEPLKDGGDLRWQTGQGSGLSLAIVRDIARAVDGEVWVEDAVRDQNCLAVSFPSLETPCAPAS